MGSQDNSITRNFWGKDLRKSRTNLLLRRNTINLCTCKCVSIERVFRHENVCVCTYVRACTHVRERKYIDMRVRRWLFDTYQDKRHQQIWVRIQQDMSANTTRYELTSTRRLIWSTHALGKMRMCLHGVGGSMCASTVPVESARGNVCLGSKTARDHSSRDLSLALCLSLSVSYSLFLSLCLCCSLSLSRSLSQGFSLSLNLSPLLNTKGSIMCARVRAHARKRQSRGLELWKRWREYARTCTIHA